MMLSSVHQASVSNAGGNFILGKTGCISSFDLAASISSALWYASCLWFSDVLSVLAERCSWNAVWETQPIFVWWIIAPFWGLNFRPQTHGKSVGNSLIVVRFSFRARWRSFRLNLSSSLPFGNSWRHYVHVCDCNTHKHTK